MLNLLILFIVICVIVGIVRALLPVILGVIIIAVVAAVIISFGPMILSLILSLLPILLVILAVLFLLGCVITLVEKCRYRSQLKKLNQFGILKLESAPADWKKLNNLGWVEIIPSGYVISIKFYKDILKHIEPVSTLTLSQFEQYCLSCAKQFQLIFVAPVLDFLQRKEFIFKFQLNNGELCLLTRAIMNKFEDLFSREGAATKNEFIQICEHSGLLYQLPQNGQGFVPFFLKYMIAHDKIQKVELSELGEYLYVSKNPCKDSKLIRREISLD